MREAAALILVLLLVGCTRAEPPPVEAAASEEPATDAPAPETTATDLAPASREIPVALDGNTGTSAVLCVAGPVGECAFQEVSPGVTGDLFENERGTITGGELVLTWDAASPATQELSIGLMWMGGGDACPSLDLGMATGPSPLTLAISPSPRELCADELIHLWVSGNTWGGQDPAYYQVDVDQAFHIEGKIVLQAPS